MERTKVIYEHYNPNDERAKYVAIQTQFSIPYVWACYYCKESVPSFNEDLVVLPINPARKLFDFKAGKIADIVKK